MTSETATVLMALAVAISSIALLICAVASLGLYRAIRRLEQQVTPLIPKAAATLDKAQSTLAQALNQIEDLSARARGVLDSSQQQLDALAEARGEITQRLRAQAERLELVLDDTISRLQDVVGVVHSGVMTPVREVAGVLTGIRTAFQTFIRNRRPSVDRATHDEEMFI